MAEKKQLKAIKYIPNQAMLDKALEDGVCECA